MLAQSLLSVSHVVHNWGTVSTSLNNINGELNQALKINQLIYKGQMDTSPAMTKILLTGHKGFIGRNIMQYLKEKGLDVDGFDVGDTLSDEQYDFIVHFAARTLIRKSLEKPYEYYKDGLDLTMQFLEKARNDGSVFIYPTSGSIEEPTNPYSLTKKQAVEWIQLYKKLFGVESHILKLYNIYGEGSGKGALYLFCKAALNGDKVTVYGDGNHVRDYTHVSDVARTVARIIGGELEPGMHEIGTGKGTSVNELIKVVENISGHTLTVQNEDYILSEADALYAKHSALLDPVRIEDGVKLVYGDLTKGDKSKGS